MNVEKTKIATLLNKLHVLAGNIFIIIGLLWLVIQFMILVLPDGDQANWNGMYLYGANTKALILLFTFALLIFGNTFNNQEN